MKAYVGISGAIFGIVAVLHLLRLVLDWPAQIGTWSVPFWVSWPALLVAAGLCIWALQLARSLRPAS
ncbi:MAG: hypothetical protein HYU76_10930 [Betaproteobacteria bacterium]|nr:hypothetical protein [Betaproteobacteria bacterium]